MLARLRRQLRAWWADSPRAQRLPGALALPAIITLAGSSVALIDPTPLRWLFAALGAYGLAFCAITTWAVLTGRRY
jgi:hypothetical protein